MKKSSNTTKKRRLKKSIRRTFGGLCMASAIIVAAIPFPEAEAYDPTSSVEQIPAYSAIVSSDGNHTIEELAETPGLTADSIVPGLSTKPLKTYAVSKRNGILSLDWQFETRSVDTGNTSKDGFITNYNNQYVADDATLEIPDLLFADYVYIALKDKTSITDLVKYEDLSSDDELKVKVEVNVGEGNKVPRMVDRIGVQYTLTGNPFDFNGDPSVDEDVINPDKYVINATYSSTPTYKFFDANFNSLLNDYIIAYKKYLTRDLSQQTIPTDITKSLLDITGDNGLNTKELQEQYICQKLLVGDTTTGLKFELVPVTRYIYQDGVQKDEQIYLFHVKDGMDSISQNTFFEGDQSRLLFTDNKCYLTTRFINMVGVAESAMEKVGNYKELRLGSSIKYICDKAFNNSSLSSVTIPNDVEIGKKAFANGKDLVSVTLGDIKTINTEAFYNTQIRDIVIPNSVIAVEDGAFANCSSLSTITFAGSSNNPVKIKAGAFADCPNITDVTFGDAKIEEIGDCAFALCEKSYRVLDKLTDFGFPKYIKTTDELGDYTLAGRSALANVFLPTGLSGVQTLPEHLVVQCPNLKSFVFPDNCNQISYDETMFLDVTNPRFYVQGPAKDGTNFSKPRECTWVALKDFNGGKTPITYRYFDGTNDIYEIYQKGEGDTVGLVLGVKDDGNLVNCQFDPHNKPTSPVSVSIPAYVGDIQVIGIEEETFKDVKDLLGELTIEDGSGIQRIADKTFKDCDYLLEVDLGNSITDIGESAFESCDSLKKVTIGENIQNIGDRAFADCKDLVDIYFDKPSNPSLMKVEGIGTDALTTGSEKLTVHGLIAPDYGPFEWSMASDNFVDSTTGLRVCYNSPAPDNLTVIVDNTNLYPTLVDYPHYEYLPEELRNKIEAGDELLPAEQYAYNCTTNIVVPEGVKSIDVNGFINKEGGTSSVTGLNNTVSANTYMKNNPDFRYYNQYKNYGLFNGFYGDEAGTIGPREFASGNDVEKVDIGNDRIDSIELRDVKYLPDYAFESCENLGWAIIDSGIEEIGKRPFTGCKKLASVVFSHDEENVTPDKFECNNLILYKNNSDGTKTIIEGLEARGKIGGSATLNINNDPSFDMVTKIEDEAFRDMESINAADFTNVNLLKKIPDKCFENCYMLTEIDLPKNVEEIGELAFNGTGDYTKVTVRNKALYLGDDSNGPLGDKVKDSYYVTYADAQSRKTAEHQKYNVNMTLDDVWTVKFYDPSGTTLIYTEYVVDGKKADGPDDDMIPEIPGKIFKGWNKSLKDPIHEDTFRLAVYEDEAGAPDLTPGVTPAPGPGGITPVPGPGGTTPAPNPSGGVIQPGGTTPSPENNETKYKLEVVYGSGSGEYVSGTTIVIEAIDAPRGKVFDKWETSGSTTPTIKSATSKATTLTMPAGNCTVTATYKNSGSEGSSGGISRNEYGNGGSSIPGNGTVVNITKPGFSNTDKAYANVNGSSDNFIVKISENAEAANAVATALSQKYGDMTPIKYFAMDISLYDATGTNKITNVNGLSVNITVPIPDALVQYAGNNRVGAVNGMTLEELPCKFVTVDGIPCVSFTATHFSPYTIYVDTGNLTYGTIDSTPKTGDGIHPKWFVSIALFATSMILFLKRDKKVRIPKTV